MKEPLIYIIESLLCGGAFLLLYRAVVIRHSSFRFSRWYLLITALLTIIIPLINIPLYPAKTVYIAVPLITTGEVGIGAIEGAIAERPLGEYIYLGLYLCVVVAMLFSMVWGAVRIRGIRRRAEPVDGYKYKVYISREIKSPFSFMSSVFLNSSLTEQEHKQVIAHEISHIEHRHPMEKIWMSFMRLLQWYNPFIWFGHHYLSEVQEYEADSDVLKAGFDVTEYRQTILKQILGYSPDITCGFNNSLTKKRFIMMTKRRRIGHIALRVSSTFGVTAVLMLLFSFTSKPTEYEVEGKKDGINKEIVVTKGKVESVKDSLLIVADSKKNSSTIIVGGEKKSEKETIIMRNKDGERPKIVVDSIEVEWSALKSMDPSSIQSIKITKKDTADGKDVVLIELKGKVSDVSYSYEAEENESINIKTPEDADNKKTTIIITGIGTTNLDPEMLSAYNIQSVSVTKSETADDKDVVLIKMREDFVLPQFPGGEKAMYEWISQNVIYPAVAVENSIEGRVVIGFTVDKEGNVVDAKVEHSVERSLDQEALRVVKRMPKWVPGTSKGEVVKVQMVIPIAFSLSKK